MAVEVENGLSKVEAGDPVRCIIGGERFDYIAAESCGNNGGHWRCVTHDKAFVNNMAKDDHCRKVNGYTDAEWANAPEEDFDETYFLLSDHQVSDLVEELQRILHEHMLKCLHELGTKDG